MHILKKSLYILLSLILFALLASPVYTAGKLQWHTFNKAQKLAVQQGKPLIVDFYADWCSWCHKMDADTFENASVSKMLTKDFVLARIDVEAKQKISFEGKEYTTRQFQSYMGVTGLPTLAFFDKKGKLITLLPGYVTPEQFKPILGYVKSECYTKKVTFKDYLNSGEVCKK